MPSAQTVSAGRTATVAQPRSAVDAIVDADVNSCSLLQTRVYDEKEPRSHHELMSSRVQQADNTKFFYDQQLEFTCLGTDVDGVDGPVQFIESRPGSDKTQCFDGQTTGASLDITCVSTDGVSPARLSDDFKLSSGDVDSRLDGAAPIGKACCTSLRSSSGTSYKPQDGLGLQQSPRTNTTQHRASPRTNTTQHSASPRTNTTQHSASPRTNTICPVTEGILSEQPPDDIDDVNMSQVDIFGAAEHSQAACYSPVTPRTVKQPERTSSSPPSSLEHQQLTHGCSTVKPIALSVEVADHCPTALCLAVTSPGPGVSDVMGLSPTLQPLEATEISPTVQQVISDIDHLDYHFLQLITLYESILVKAESKHIDLVVNL